MLYEVLLSKPGSWSTEVVVSSRCDLAYWSCQHLDEIFRAAFHLRKIARGEVKSDGPLRIRLLEVQSTETLFGDCPSIDSPIRSQIDRNWGILRTGVFNTKYESYKTD